MRGGIYGITTKDLGLSHEECARAFLTGGVRIIQYREKSADTKTMITEAMRIKDLCKRYGATFIVDDRTDVALAVDADGVHLGQDDMQVSVAKRILPGKIIGVSAKTVEQAAAAEKEGATYLGVGTIFPTKTHVKTMLIGLDGFRRVRESTSLPCFGIGGMRVEHVKVLKECGAAGVAVITAIVGAKDPASEARRFVEEWNSTIK
jgi:thiamine-phosphate pyrophosphorylase